MSKIPMHTEVTAIVVTYNPNMSALKALCERLTTQAGHVIIVDNHSQSTLQSFVEQWSNVELIESSENLGIA